MQRYVIEIIQRRKSQDSIVPHRIYIWHSTSTLLDLESEAISKNMSSYQHPC